MSTCKSCETNANIMAGAGVLQPSLTCDNVNSIAGADCSCDSCKNIPYRGTIAFHISNSQFCVFTELGVKKQNLSGDSLVTKHTAQGPPSFWKPFIEGEAGCLALATPVAFTRFTGLGGAASHTCTGLILLGASHTSSSCNKSHNHMKCSAWQHGAFAYFLSLQFWFTDEPHPAAATAA